MAMGALLHEVTNKVVSDLVDRDLDLDHLRALTSQYIHPEERLDLVKVQFHTPALRARTLADHEAIVSALAARDADGARKAMRRHLERVAREFQRRWDEPGGGSGENARARPTARARPKSTSHRAQRRIHEEEVAP